MRRRGSSKLRICMTAVVTAAAALNGIESVKKNAPDANTDDQTGG